jgi:class 3 adenylate cyclase/putative methionine-R-sulfoxide reductase with GAF domain
MSQPSTASLLDKQDLLALLDTANQLNTMATLEEMLTHILRLAGKLCNSPAGSVLLHDPQRQELYFAAATGPAVTELPKIRIPVGKGKAGAVFASGQPLVENQLQDHYKEVDKQTEFTTKSMICVPLVHRNHTYGVMQVLNKADGAQPFDDRDLELITHFALQATVAIRNAHLFEQLISSSGLYAAHEVRKDLVQQMTEKGTAAVTEKFSVLFADIRSFSRFCNEVVRARKIQALLSDYIAMLASLVVSHQGIVNKFQGDGLMAIFRTDRGAANAVQCAMAMVEGFDRLRTAWEEVIPFSLDYLDIGIGIATDDEIILGRIGDDKFHDFTVIGPAVNLAAALEHSARNGKRILCDQLTYASLKDKTLVQAEGPTKFTLEKLGQGGTKAYSIYYLKRPAPAAQAPAVAPTGQCDVFFSYRREGGSHVARSIQQALKDGYSIFLDVDRLGVGHFDTALLRMIESAPNFVVFLTKGSLDRCHLPDDWLRKEIIHALKTQRNVVPVRMPDFEFPPPHLLPDEMRELTLFDAVEYNHIWFNPMIEKIRTRLKK